MAKTIYRDEYVTFLRLLRERRAAAGLTQAQCSAALGRPQSFVSDVERGSRRLDIVQLRDLCAVLRTDLIDFVRSFEKAVVVRRKGAGLATSSKARRHR
jgi:transcriptional regulator with XRE-family HTH domain